jgi:hypothetical protein
LTDTSTKGLLPQLTEVLLALADSHAMLLSKVQSLRLGHADAAPSVVTFTDTRAHTHIGALAGPHSPQRIDIMAPPILDAPRALPHDQAEPTDTRSSIVTAGLDGIPDATTNQHVLLHGSESHVASPPAATAAESEPAQPHIDMAETAHTPPRHSGPLDHLDLDRLDAERSDPTGDGSEGRDYNYFDDLDARLAGLGMQNPEHNPE